MQRSGKGKQNCPYGSQEIARYTTSLLLLLQVPHSIYADCSRIGYQDCPREPHKIKRVASRKKRLNFVKFCTPALDWQTTGHVLYDKWKAILNNYFRETWQPFRYSFLLSRTFSVLSNTTNFFPNVEFILWNTFITTFNAILL